MAFSGVDSSTCPILTFWPGRCLLTACHHCGTAFPRATYLSHKQAVHKPGKRSERQLYGHSLAELAFRIQDAGQESRLCPDGGSYTCHRYWGEYRDFHSAELGTPAATALPPAGPPDDCERAR